MKVIANYRLGRICLHAVALIVDREFKWHVAGIRRELVIERLASSRNG